MTSDRRRFSLGVLLLVAIILPAAVPSASAQTDTAANYPTRPIRLVVGFAAGGGNDILARLIGQKLSESFGQPVIVENKPGAGAIIATEYVKNAAPDGHTLLVGASGAMTINPAVYAKLNYATLRDFVPISMVASFPLVLVVNAASPVKSVQDVVAYAKANPQKANYASSSAAFQLATELFKMKTGAPMVLIPYKSSAESVTAVISGEVLLTIADPGPVSGQLSAGLVRALAVTSANRAQQLPDVPTMAEQGVSDLEIGLWSGLFAPAGTPPAIVTKIEDEIARIVKLPDIRERFNTLAVEPAGGGSEDFGRIIAGDIERWTAVAKAANIKIEQ